jgi:hypothetical protein
MGSALEQLAC